LDTCDELLHDRAAVDSIAARRPARCHHASVAVGCRPRRRAAGALDGLLELGQRRGDAPAGELAQLRGMSLCELQRVAGIRWLDGTTSRAACCSAATTTKAGGAGLARSRFGAIALAAATNEPIVAARA
jgi:hypothetical protein